MLHRVARECSALPRHGDCMRKMFAFLAAAAALTMAAPAAAATLVIDSTTAKVTGATRVIVNGTSYDVNFLDGTCSYVFGGCDSTSDFDFTSDAAAAAAGEALLAQVFNQTVGGINYDTNYAMTAGCATNSSNTCSIVIPTTYDFWANATGTVNAALEANDRVWSGYGANPTLFDTSSDATWTWADFYLSGSPRPVYGAAAVPEPAT